MRSLLEGRKMKQSIEYVGVEAYPISAEELMSMNYVEELNAEDEKENFEKIISTTGKKMMLSDQFSLTRESSCLKK
jgi:hypothetical protein